MLHQMSNILTEITEAFEEYQFFKFFQKVQNFCVVDLSNFYLDVAKDRLYISDLNSPRRRSCQTVMAIIVENLAKVIAPVLSHTAEDIWQNLPYETGFKSVFESGWIKLETQWSQNPEILAKGEKLRTIRTGVNQILEKARTEKLIGSSLEAKVLIYDESQKLTDWLTSLNPIDSLNSENRVDELRYLMLVSQIEIVTDGAKINESNYHDVINLGDSNLKIAVVKADGEKCDRCWNYSTKVGEFKDDPTICERCNDALVGKF
jgi:isoleucyl-tRNA synthetase